MNQQTNSGAGDLVSGEIKPVAEEPVAWMYPSDIEKFASQETFATVFSVQVGCPDELSVPLYTRPAAHDDLVTSLNDLYTLIHDMGWKTPDNRYASITNAAAALAKAGVK